MFFLNVKKAREFCECFRNHKVFWSILSENLAKEEVLKSYKEEYTTFEEVKAHCMEEYCSENGLNVPECECFACAISNNRSRLRWCQSNNTYIPCILNWCKEHCFNAGTPYSKLLSLYKNEPDPSPAILSKLAEEISNTPLNPKAFYIFVDVQPGDKMRHYRGDTFIFDSVSQYAETGELIVNYHSLNGSNYSVPLMMFFEEVNEKDYSGPRFRKEV